MSFSALELEQILLGLVFASQIKRVKLEDLSTTYEKFNGLEVLSFAKLCRQELAIGTGSANGLTGNFKRTLNLLQLSKVEQNTLFDIFVASEHFNHAKTLPFSGIGITAEEAFFYFMTEQNLPATVQQVLTHEFCTAIITLLAVNANPGFQVKYPDLITREQIYWIAKHYSQENAADIDVLRSPRESIKKDGQFCYLYATNQGRMIYGWVPEQVPRVLKLGSLSLVENAINNDNDLDRESATDAALHMHKLGLMSP